MVVSIPRDEQRVPLLGGVSKTDGTTPLVVYVDDATNRLMVQATIEPELARSPFGDLEVSEITPDVHLQFPYNINAAQVKSRANQSGTVTQNADMARLQTGAAANSSGELLSIDTIKSHPGQGGIVRFSAFFTTGVANSNQVVGIGDTGDGYFFGYDGDTFGIRSRKSGLPEVRTLTVSTKSTDADSITITLNGNTKAVTVSDATATDATTTANEIADADYSDTGRGWDANAVGNTVVFISWCAGARSGTYDLTDATSAVGSYAQTEAGVDDVETIVAQTAWNGDKMDGTGLSGMTLDPTKGNVYQIKYQDGFGDIEFFVEHDTDGRLELVHRIQYANANTTLSIDNPTLPLYAGALNGSNTTNLTLNVGSLMGGILGREVELGPRHGTTVTSATFTSGTERPVLTIRNREVYQSVVNRTSMILSFAGLSQDGTKTGTVKFTFNATLTGASFSDVSANTSVAQVDTAATVISGGTVAFAQGIARTDKTLFELSDEDVILHPGDSLTISLIANANNPDVTAAFNWIDDF